MSHNRVIPDECIPLLCQALLNAALTGKFSDSENAYFLKNAEKINDDYDRWCELNNVRSVDPVGGTFD